MCGVSGLNTAADRDTNPLCTAEGYVERGFAVIPIPRGSKSPRIPGWQHLRLSRDELTDHFRESVNIGVLMGEPSGWLVDVDLDHPMAVELADIYLPPTEAEFGRPGKPRSHRLYRVEGAQTKRWKLPGKGTIAELRSSGCQTVMPASTHPSGELVTWHKDGTPAVTSVEELGAALEALVGTVGLRLGVAPGRRSICPSASAVTNNMASPVGALERCRRYVERMPAAISGQGGHDATFAVACECFRYGLSKEDALVVLRVFNRRCQPPWTERELEHKVDDAQEEVMLSGEFGSRIGESDVVALGASCGGETGNRLILRPENRTEAAAARRFVAQHREDVRYCEPWGKWLLWDGRRWAIDDSCKVEALAKETAKSIWGDVLAVLPNASDRGVQTSLLNYAKSTESANGIMHVLTLARSEPGIAIRPRDLDRDPWLLNAGNLTINLRTSERYSHRREDFITKLCPVDFDIGADCQRWRDFVVEIMNNDTEKVEFLRRLAGLWLTGCVTEHVLPIFYGVGANGKSVYLNTMMALLGDDYAMKAPHDFLMAKRNDPHPTEKADLYGKRLVCCIETENGRWLAESQVKELTGGDRIRARRMREDFWEFQPTHKLVVAANHKPRIKGTDNGIWRRVNLVPFDVIISEANQDKMLPERLKDELPGILNWAMLGCEEWRDRGLSPPTVVAAATIAYRDENNLLAQFIEEECVKDESAHVESTALFQAFAEYGKSSGEFISLSRAEFNRQLDQLGFADARSTAGPHKGRKIRRGLGLRAAERFEDRASEGSEALAA